MDKVAVVLGVGPGLGSSLAERFARGGYAVALNARGEEKLAPVRQRIEEAGGKAVSFPGDVTAPAAMQRIFTAIREQLGDPEVLCYNAGAFQMGGILDLDPGTFERCWRANCFGGFLAAQQVLPAMVEKGRGTILFTGATAALRGSTRFAALAVGKFGLRALAQSLAREFGPQGIHVAHVVIDGQILSPRVRKMLPDRAPETFLDPDRIAEVYWHLHTQDRTTWTLETDLRPAVETF